MGRKIQMKSDPRIAEPHAGGSKLVLVQPALHATYGTLMIPRPMYWSVHLSHADAAFDRLRSLDEAVLAVPLGASNTRIVGVALGNALYLVGTDLVVHLVLALQQLILEIEIATRVPVPQGADLNTRLTNALRAIGFLSRLDRDARYAQLAEIQRVRDSVEHPKESNIYAEDVSGWDAIPIAWFASGKASHAYSGARSLVREIVAFWSEAEPGYRRPGPLQVERGMKSLHQSKKPRPKQG